MRIAVTGSRGKIGRWVVAALREAGRSVRGVDLVPPADPADRDYTIADLTDLGQALAAIRGADSVVHLAGIPHPINHPHEVVFQTNTLGTYNILEACALQGVGRVVFASSDSVYGFPFATRKQPPAYLPLDEDYPCVPQDGYGQSKLAGELLCRGWAARTGGTAISLRISWVHTPDEYPALVARQADPAVPSHNLWGYVDIRDVASACLAAVTAPIPGGYAICNITAADSSAAQDSAPLAARYYPGEYPVRLEGRQSLYSLERARQVLGWEPRFGTATSPATTKKFEPNTAVADI